MSRHRHTFTRSSGSPLRLGIRAHRPPGPIRSLLFFLPFVGGAIALIAVTVGTWGSHLDWRARAATYEQAPGCNTDPTGTSSDQGCAWRQATVVAADSVEDDSGDAPTYTYFLTFQIGGATTDREEIPSESTWGRVSQGDQVSVEMWQGHVTQVAYGGDRFPTESNPSYRRAHPGTFLLLALPVSSLVYTSLIVLVLYRTWRYGTAGSPRVRTVDI